MDFGDGGLANLLAICDGRLAHQGLWILGFPLILDISSEVNHACLIDYRDFLPEWLIAVF